ncbi:MULTISPECIES: very short patch repair endonuclease [Rhizobium]|uniref:Very short patch repair endonuclease n=1 Tax=Rhizobium leguminosarum bv. viciae TaxID=387 RepID=A0A8G2IRG8_RHILV|nr:very short patch repair endonuclease [Rhizobium leguminosarum]NKK11047.1 DNA mismatch endonuclease Vsr [Rhizobium leguminosarum bv. viciae]NKK19434.1 DNA mismatch endonuclease Vsr [Rhizobium leguminosarum bv. viciae]TBX85222.1 DNA mismatch endonuclease Vsr [Rhizobium leguminosarum bv. viciae]TBZ08656.1 DNA mismatch endonuclease Vsr [Rhizobium leguminosarum bv. viciae]UIK00983.1 very short patch repair endonuclease [Rhizobium leguminosarum]
MIDIVDKATRSRMMAGIKRRDTKPEMLLRQALHARGLRYRLHTKLLPGRPDLIFGKYHAVVFVHGCFWHRHAGCRYCTTPKSNPEFWESKFAGNVSRDAAVAYNLLRAGWRVGIVWECALRGDSKVEAAVASVHSWLLSGSSTIELGDA